MTGRPQFPRRYRFDVFELRPDEGELIRAGAAVAIQPQPLKVLTFLVERSGNLVRRAELVAAIWGEDTHVDYDRGLNYCIKQIRTVLGDDAADPRFVRTLPRQGYRFIADVERPGPSAPRVDGLPVRRPAMRRAAAAGAAAFALVLLTLSITWWFAPASSEAPAADPRALEAFLRGQHLAQTGEPADLAASLEHMQRAVALDPRFARGHLGVARSWLRMPGAPTANAERSRTAVLRALELDPNLAEAHAHLAALKHYGDWDWKGADEAYGRAVRLAPDSATLRHGYANFLGTVGRHDAAIAQIEHAMELDPLSTSIKADAGWFYYQARQYGDAVRLCEVTLELEPENRDALWCVLQSRRAEGSDLLATLAAQRLVRVLAPEGAPAVEDLAGFWRWYLEWLERHPAAGTPSSIGLAYLALGDETRALELFEQAYDTHSSCVLPIAMDPQVDPLRGNPRFDDLLVKLGLDGR